MNAIHAANDLSLPALVLAELNKSGLSPQLLVQAEVFCNAFFARVGGSNVDLHSPTQWAALVGSLLDFVQQRPAGRAVVRVLSPVDMPAGRSLLQIVTDDSPFLIDTVSMVVSGNLQIHAVIHPVLSVQRDASGMLQSLGEPAGHAESVMHFEIDRVADAAEQAQLKVQIEAALDDVRASVTDWAAMRQRALTIAAELPQRMLPLDAASVEEAATLGALAGGGRVAAVGCHRRDHPDQDQCAFACASSGLHGLRRCAAVQ
jgi:glutamate dehydrogenase